MALTAEEIEARDGLLTSSIAPAIFDLDPYSGPLTAQMLIKRQLPPTPGNPATLRGDLCEPACLEYARRVMLPHYPGGLSWEKPPFKRHPNGWMGCSTDAIYRDVNGRAVALGEAKTVSARSVEKWGQPGTDEVPDRVLVQCCWHMACWPVDVVWVPVLQGGWDFEFELYVVRRDAALIADLMAEAERWHKRHIIGDEPAAATGRDTCALKVRWPRSDAGEMEMTPELESLVAEKARWRSIRVEAEAKEADAHAKVAGCMQNHGHAVSSRFSVSYRRTKDGTKIEWERLAQVLGATEEQVAEHTITVPGYRVLRVTERKDRKKK